MKGEKTLQLLEHIGDAAVDSVDLLGAFLSSGYGASLGQIQYKANQLSNQRVKKKNNYEKQLRQRFYEVIYRLEKDGIISKVQKNNKKLVRLTPVGRNKKESLLKRRENILPKPFYDGLAGDRLVIVIFDIPEKERNKRDWLRLVLNNLGLKFLQKSVWVGKVKLPRELLEDLKNLGLIQYVEIFEIGKAGSLRQVK